MPINFNLNKYKNPIFVETGTYQGDGVKKALECGFENIYSIEIDYNRYLNCKKLFSNYKNVEIIHGDSSIELPKLLKRLNNKITFWIDAHYSADGAYIGDKWCPLKEELDAIKNHNIKNHIILIDDWRCMNNTHIDYTWKNQMKGDYSNKTVDQKNGKEVGFLGKDNCLEILKNINNDFKFYFENGIVKDDVLVCKMD